MAIERVAVIGAGTMGAGIAQVCAQAGWTTALYDAFPEGLERGMQRIDAFWDKGIARGKTTPEQKEARIKIGNCRNSHTSSKNYSHTPLCMPTPAEIRVNSFIKFNKWFNSILI